MIRVKTITINGEEYTHRWSDESMKIERDGALYEEAIDPVDSGRMYTETDIPIDTDDAEAEEADYMAALERFGV